MPSIPIKVEVLKPTVEIAVEIGLNMDSMEVARFLHGLREIQPSRSFYVNWETRQILSRPRRDV